MPYLIHLRLSLQKCTIEVLYTHSFSTPQGFFHFLTLKHKLKTEIETHNFNFKPPSISKSSSKLMLFMPSFQSGNCAHAKRFMQHPGPNKVPIKLRLKFLPKAALAFSTELYFILNEYFH